MTVSHLGRYAEPPESVISRFQNCLEALHCWEEKELEGLK